MPLADLKADGFVAINAPITSGFMDFVKEVDIKGTVTLDAHEIMGYDVFGCAVAEVELDTLTGENNILQVDLVYDAAKSLNPVIDLGQIQGAFMVRRRLT